MARKIYRGYARDGNGTVLSGATVSVYLTGTSTVASIYTASSGGTAVNSVDTDSTGLYYFYTDYSDYTAGTQFRLTISKTGFDSVTYDDVECLPPTFSTDGTCADNSDSEFMSEKAVKTYADTAAAAVSQSVTASLPVFTDGSKKLVSNAMTGTGKVVMDTSPTLVTPTIGAASGTSLTLSGLTASLPVFSDGSKKLESKSVADTLTALGVGSAAFYATIGNNHLEVTGDGTNYPIAGTWTEVIDTGSCFSSGVFTAPATGWYVFSAYIYISGITSSHTSGGIYLVLNGTLVSEFYGNIYAVSTPSGGLGTGLSQVAYLEATKTAYLLIDISGGTKVINITGLRFCGFRLK